MCCSGVENHKFVYLISKTRNSSKYHYRHQHPATFHAGVSSLLTSSRLLHGFLTRVLFKCLPFPNMFHYVLRIWLSVAPQSTILLNTFCPTDIKHCELTDKLQPISPECLTSADSGRKVFAHYKLFIKIAIKSTIKLRRRNIPIRIFKKLLKLHY